MKTKLAVLLIIFATTSLGCIAQDVDMKGTWKMLSRGEVPVTEGYYQVKLITSTHFTWLLTDSDGNIISGAAGTYKMNKDTYTEHITMVLPGMKNFINKKATYTVKIVGKKMTITGKIDNKIVNEEIWEKID